MKKYKYVKTFSFNGKRYKVYADTLEEAILKKDIKLKKLENEDATIHKDISFREWAEKWLTVYKEPNVSAESFRLNKSIVQSTLIPAMGMYQLRKIKPVHVQEFINEFSKTHSPLYTRQVKSVLKQVFKTALENKIINSNPCTNIQLKPVNTSRRSLTDYEVYHFLKLADTHPIGMIIKIMYYCGLRPGEVFALQWKHVDLKKRIISVEQSTKLSDHRIGQTKTKSGIRKVPIPVEFKIERPENVSPFDFVCVDENGNRYNYSLFGTKWRNFKNCINIQMGCNADENGNALPPYRLAADVVPYMLRHTFCTRLQDAGVPINIAKELMGHSDIATTSKIYTHKTETSLEIAREKINDFNAKCDTFCDTRTETR